MYHILLHTIKTGLAPVVYLDHRIIKLYKNGTNYKWYNPACARLAIGYYQHVMLSFKF